MSGQLPRELERLASDVRATRAQVADVGRQLLKARELVSRVRRDLDGSASAQSSTSSTRGPL